MAGGSGGWRRRGSRVGGFTTFNCVTRGDRPATPTSGWSQGLSTRWKRRALWRATRKWLERCNPIVERDRYGVGRLRYAAPGCEFGVSED